MAGVVDPRRYLEALYGARRLATPEAPSDAFTRKLKALRAARARGEQMYTPEEVAAIVDEAHMHGRRVAVHAHGANGIKVALKAGVDTIEHASLIDQEGLDLAKKTGAFLSMDIFNTEYTQSEGPKRGEMEEFLRKDREVAQAQRDNFRKAVQMGIKLTMGTDTGVHPHKDAPKQLAYMVQYGMTPMQALQAAMHDQTSDPNGSGSYRVFGDMPFPIAGKTGTAQRNDSATAKPHSWFASFGPYGEPAELATAVMYESAGEGVSFAAPATRRIYEAWLQSPLHAATAPAG